MNSPFSVGWIHVVSILIIYFNYLLDLVGGKEKLSNLSKEFPSKRQFPCLLLECIPHFTLGMMHAQRMTHTVSLMYSKQFSPEHSKGRKSDAQQSWEITMECVIVSDRVGISRRGYYCGFSRQLLKYKIDFMYLFLTSDISSF